MMKFKSLRFRERMVSKGAHKLVTYSNDVFLRTKTRLEIVDVTKDVYEIIDKSGIRNGLVIVWTTHTTAAIAINEHDVDLWADILQTLTLLIPIEAKYRHNAKYSWSSKEQNAHAHILNCLIKPNVMIPLQNSVLALGTWQAILFIELDGPRNRSLYVQIVGE
jgi:secondary thiamine-phosphate synthase enzyme